MDPTPTDLYAAGQRLVRDSATMAPVCLAYSVEAARHIVEALNASLSFATTAPPESLEPRERYVVRPEGCYFHVDYGTRWIARCWSQQDAERIAALLNKEEGSER
jgi:hypothetical protein